MKTKIIIDRGRKFQITEIVNDEEFILLTCAEICKIMESNKNYKIKGDCAGDMGRRIVEEKIIEYGK